MRAPVNWPDGTCTPTTARGEVMAIAVSGAGTDATVNPEPVVLANAGQSVSAVASGPDGAVYVLGFDDAVYRLDPA